MGKEGHREEAPTAPPVSLKESLLEENPEKAFYGSEEDEAKGPGSEEAAAATLPTRKPYVMDPDHRLLLRNTKPLLQSRSAAVVMAVAQLYFHLAPKAEVGVIAKALVRLLRSHRCVPVPGPPTALIWPRPTARLWAYPVPHRPHPSPPDPSHSSPIPSAPRTDPSSALPLAPSPHWSSSLSYLVHFPSPTRCPIPI